MNNGAFEWDDQKAASNCAKHGVKFEPARGVINDPFAIERLDDRANYREEHFILIGMASGRLLAVVYAMRGKTIRIISARGAEPYEQRQHHEQSA
jgi:uncharacterized DUF497 family protein